MSDRDPEPHPAATASERPRLLRAFNFCFAFVLLLVAVFTMQSHFDVRFFSVRPQQIEGLPGILTAPLLHGSVEHLAANAIALLILGSLTIAMYPKALMRSLPLIWIGAGLGAWALGKPSSYHLGASGLTHGLMFLIFILGLLRRDRASIATGMIAFFFYGGMLLTILPMDPSVSWQSHMGGAIGGAIGALLFRHADPLPPKPHYSWEDEDALEESDSELELPRPNDVPVLRQWPHEERRENVVVPLRSRPPSQDSPHV